MKINKRTNLRFLFVGGGTGGHVYPALSIADEIKKEMPDSEILFVGIKNKIETKLVPSNGYRISTIWLSGFQRKMIFKNLLLPIKIFVSFFQSILLLKNYKPNIVLGTGGYVCGPVIIASRIFRIPTVIHESNSYPGITTKILSKFANLTLLGFENAVKYFSNSQNLQLIGNPTREVGSKNKNLAAKYFNLNGNKKILLVFGGSLGAKSINKSIEKNLKKIQNLGFQIIWQTGNDNFEKFNSKSICVLPFIDNMNMAYSAADLVLSRSGAISVSEIVAANKKAIFVPYPFATENHQYSNAVEGLKKITGKIIADDKIQTELISAIKEMIKKKNCKN